MTTTAGTIATALVHGGLGEQTVSDLTEGLKQMRAAYPGYARAEAYYTGDVSEVFSHARIASLLGRTKDRYRVNFAKTPVNVIADRLNIGSVIVKTKTSNDTDSPPDPNTPDPEANNDYTRQFEQEVWKAAKMERKSATIHKKVSEYGDAYLFVWPNTPTPQNPSELYVQYNSPKTTRTIYDPDNTEIALFTIKMWMEGQRVRVTLYYPNRIERLISKTVQDTISPTPGSYRNGISITTEAEQKLQRMTQLTGDDFEPYVPLNDPSRLSRDEIMDDEIGDSPLGLAPHILGNPFERIPLVHFRNEFPYGVPEHYDAYGPQDALNKISTTLMHSVEFQGFPQRYGLAHPNSELGGDTNAGAGPWDDEEQSTDTDTDDNAIDSGPGTIAVLKGMAEVGQFEAAQSSNFLGPADFYVRAMAQTTDTPLRFFFPPSSHAPSGESVRAEDAPLNQKLGRRERTYNDPWAEFASFGMEILTDTEAQDFDITVRWQPRASIEDALGWQTVRLKIDTGVPIRQALVEAGYSADQVDTWLASNLDRFELKRDIGMLAELTTAAQALGAVGQAGLVPPLVLRELLFPLFEKLTGKRLPAPDDAPLTQPPAPPQQTRPELPRPFGDKDQPQIQQ
jgi:hypothetical protein